MIISLSFLILSHHATIIGIFEIRLIALLLFVTLSSDFSLSYTAIIDTVDWRTSIGFSVLGIFLRVFSRRSGIPRIATSCAENDSNASFVGKSSLCKRHDVPSKVDV